MHDALAAVPIQRPANNGRKRKGLDSVEFGGTVRVLPVASRPANPTDVLATRGVGVILEQLRSEADLVLVDAPPLLEGSDASALSTHVDAIVAIVDLGRDRRGQLAEARRRLAATSATVLGFIGTGKTDEATAYTPDRAGSTSVWRRSAERRPGAAGGARRHARGRVDGRTASRRRVRSTRGRSRSSSVTTARTPRAGRGSSRACWSRPTASASSSRSLLRASPIPTTCSRAGTATWPS